MKILKIPLKLSSHNNHQISLQTIFCLTPSAVLKSISSEKFPTAFQREWNCVFPVVAFSLRWKFSLCTRQCTKRFVPVSTKFISPRREIYYTKGWKKNTLLDVSRFEHTVGKRRRNRLYICCYSAIGKWLKGYLILISRSYSAKWFVNCGFKVLITSPVASAASASRIFYG